MRSDRYMLLWTVSRVGSVPIGSDSVFGSYTHVPPMRLFFSKTTTSRPSLWSSLAATSPAAPAPITATFTDGGAMESC